MSLQPQAQVIENPHITKYFALIFVNLNPGLLLFAGSPVTGKT